MLPMFQQISAGRKFASSNMADTLRGTWGVEPGSPQNVRLQTPNLVLPSYVALGQSVQFSRSVVSNSLWPHESQHTRPPCPSPTPGVHSNSCSSSQWCHPAISSSVSPFSSCPQSLPASGSFPVSQLFAWGGQSTGFLFSISPSNEHPGLISFRMDRLDLLAVQGTLKSLLQHHSSKASILWCSVSLFNSLSFSFIFWAWCFLYRSNRTVIVVVILTPHQKCSVLFRYTTLVIWCSLTMSYSPHSQPLTPSQFFFYLCEWGHRDKYGYVL